MKHSVSRHNLNLILNSNAETFKMMKCHSWKTYSSHVTFDAYEMIKEINNSDSVIYILDISLWYF